MNRRLAAIAVAANAALALPLPGQAAESAILDKLQPYIKCANELSERAYSSRSRYRSWAADSGPTGKERNIYGTYTISDPAECAKSIDAANAREPHDPELEAAGTAYAKSVTALAPLLKEADDYYEQGNYKDDKMAKGRILHPRLMAAWAGFESAETKLSRIMDALGDAARAEELAALEKAEGRAGTYFVQALMMKAKALLNADGSDDPKAVDMAKLTGALGDYEALVKEADQYAGAHKDKKIGSMFMGRAKSFLASAKGLMRRVRDKTPYTEGEKMIMDSGGGGGWMVDGSPARVARDYNDLVDAFNMGGSI